MDVRNFLVEGVSGMGKSSVADELARRGHPAIHGDRALAYQGDPTTGEKKSGSVHERHIWDVERVRALAADDTNPITFFCGGSRNFAKLIDLFDEVFVLDIDRETLNQRLDRRPADEYGLRPSERELILRLHRTGENLPPGVAGTGLGSRPEARA